MHANRSIPAANRLSRMVVSRVYPSLKGVAKRLGAVAARAQARGEIELGLAEFVEREASNEADFLPRYESLEQHEAARARWLAMLDADYRHDDCDDCVIFVGIVRRVRAKAAEVLMGPAATAEEQAAARCRGG